MGEMVFCRSRGYQIDDERLTLSRSVKGEKKYFKGDTDGLYNVAQCTLCDCSFKTITLLQVKAHIDIYIQGRWMLL